ncbi:hypothetical protein M5K25_008911 [Dendrobium thyrsiflorum]|uniref:Polymerase nucleotidyl transferase domain-containing protein n=1 Tax=Dendrobium thyrsiflorum TaxID=117978 RepID=A0ABD0VH22_DENTH
MGENEAWSHSGGLLLNGLLPNEVGNVPRVLDEERWAKAEERTDELLACIQPNRPSEERRNDVAKYVQKLIMERFSCEVFTFGSVPLKTYLPDGDIDLTAFNKDEDMKDNWANEVREVLENEERSESADFRVKEVQYIQAEVKIIKCLVENIVVDISFNQVGGLCTLCFLEEIDHLINQNHLFKRSIILIKAWCYYESRILGAHHGLISTYALETLVLYIFHVFNNSFNGPLEVLYRFLEFFSHFDWDNFCVSLWGPVPISSLPDMSAESPRKDGGELLLSGLFLEACSSVYAVFPSGQENQGQQFVSKHFNVIDPLRTNNNLGRSVSKGNFYRIRSAFAFGAKRLARLLDCPKEDLIAEVNQFFMNTWERHGRGNRPDAPSLTNRSLRPSKKGSAEESKNSGVTASLTKSTGSIGPQVGLDHQPKGSHAFHRSVSQVLNTTEHSPNAYRTSNPSMFSRAPGQKGNSNQINSRDSDHLEKNLHCGKPVKSDKNQKILRPNYTDLDERVSFQFSRTQSSPELTETSVNAPSRMRSGRVAEASKTFSEHLRSEYGSRRKNNNSEVSSIQSARSSFDDPSFFRPSSSQQSLEAATDSNSVSNSYHDDTGFTTVGEELGSVSDALELQQQEQQDMINMMASSRVHNFIGQVQLPIHFTSPHPPLPLSPYLASMGYAQRNLVTLIDPSWGSTMQFPQGFVSSQFPHYFPNVNSLKSNSDELESGNEIPHVNAIIPEDGEHDAWHGHDVGSARGFETDNGGQMPRFDERQHSSPRRFKYVPSSTTNNSMSGHQKFATENKVSRDDYPNAFQQQSSGTNDIGNDRNAKMRHIPVLQVSSARGNLYSETSRDGPNVKPSILTRNKWGRSTSTAVTNSLRGKAKSERQYEVASEPASSHEDDESGGWASTSAAATNMEERVISSAPLMPVHSRSQLSGYEQEQIRGAESMIPFAPMLVGGSRQKLAENSGVIPFTFYPTGPPVPFLTMVPVYNFPADGANADGSTNRVDKDDEAEHLHASTSDQNFDSVENYDQLDGLMNLSTSKGATAPDSYEEHKPDILHSDFASHWQNLQYGRFCQNTRNHGPLTYSPPVMVPPVYLQGHFPMDGPGRPHSANMNFTQVMGYGPRLVPVAPLQPGPSRPSGVFHRYGDDSPRYRSGTGTYLPNLKPSFRERQYSNARNHRGSYKHDRGDQADREGSWINAKARSAGRGHARNQNERSNFRSDRSVTSDNRQWDSYRPEQFAPHQAQNISFRPSNLQNNSASLPYGIYPLPGGSSNGVGSTVPSVVMLYPYEQGVGYGPPAESFEFGSFGPVHLPNHEGPRHIDGNPIKRIHDPRHSTNRGGSPRSSPDQPSSPQIPPR